MVFIESPETGRGPTSSEFLPSNIFPLATQAERQTRAGLGWARWDQSGTHGI